MSADADPSELWDENDSRKFLDYGPLFVPRREEQMRVVVDLLPAGPIEVLELCCGAGDLASRILERRPDATVTALDGSPAMIQAAQRANERFGSRFRGAVAALESLEPRGPLDAVVSSLAIHHLDHDAKRRLYRGIAEMLRPRGALLIADIVEPLCEPSRHLAAAQWDEAVVEAAEAAGAPHAVELFRTDGWNHFDLETPDPLDRPAPIVSQLEWLAEAGLEKVAVFWQFAGHAIFGGFEPA